MSFPCFESVSSRIVIESFSIVMRSPKSAVEADFRGVPAPPFDDVVVVTLERVALCWCGWGLGACCIRRYRSIVAMEVSLARSANLSKESFNRFSSSSAKSWYFFRNACSLGFLPARSASTASAFLNMMVGGGRQTNECAVNDE